MRAVGLLVIAMGYGRVDFDRIDALAGSPDALSEPLIAQYSMDSITGGILVDDTPNDHNGSCAALDCPAVTAGRVNTALQFDGVMHQIWVDAVEAKSDAVAQLAVDDEAITLGADLDSGQPLCAFMGALDDIRSTRSPSINPRSRSCLASSRRPHR